MAIRVEVVVVCCVDFVMLLFSTASKMTAIMASTPRSRNYDCELKSQALSGSWWQYANRMRK